MSKTTSDQILERLHAWGVHRVYGYPGDGINGLMAAFERIGDRMQFVQTRHEELAAFAACAHAKFTGEVGVCMATSGPGAIHLLNGLYDAKADHQPVVAIVGQSARSALGGDYQQEVDLQSLFKDVAHEYVQTAMVPAQIRHLVDRAMRIARDQRTVTCVIVPHDLQELAAVEQPPREHDTIHSSIGITGKRIVPPQDDLRATADLLNAGKKVAILAGAGALHATDELIQVAERLGAGIAKALLGKAAVPDDLPIPSGENDRRHDEATLRGSIELAKITDGGIFVLFTSYRALRSVAEGMRRRGTDRGWPLFVQGEAPRAQLVRGFIESGRGILLGTTSFWEGVDVPGRPLRGLVIPKLPFKVPSEPVTAARIEAIEAQGGNSFTSYMLPHAAIRLKQGFGRLIRSRSDHGAVLVLDPRLVKKSYGRYLVESLPPAPLVTGRWNEVREALCAFYGDSGIRQAG